MKIIENDFKIEYDGTCFILYLLKPKKELKADSDPFKLKGYYTHVENALFAAYKWRLDKKYPYNEPTIEFKKNLIELRKSVELLKHCSYLVYKSIYDLKEKIFYENR